MTGEIGHAQTAEQSRAGMETIPYDPEQFILLVGFGGQLEPKIYRELVTNGYNTHRLIHTAGQEPDLSHLNLANLKGVLFSGGNDSVYDEDARLIPRSLLDLPVPKMGICYGEQALAHQLGGVVKKGEDGEYGVTEIVIDETSLLFRGIQNHSLRAMMSRRDGVTELPDGCKVIAWSGDRIAGFSNEIDLFATQFHPESSETEHGTRILLNFAAICGLMPEPDFTTERYLQRYIEEEERLIQETFADETVEGTALQSGGVDSALAQVMQTEALRKVGRRNLPKGLYVDTGLMREEDGDTVDILNSLGYEVEKQDWSELFLDSPVPLPPAEAARRGYTHLPPMYETSDVKTKRQIVKYGFMEVQRLIAQELQQGADGLVALTQGTNLADLLESGVFSGDQIKEHHNSGVEEFVDILLEPLKGLFKGDIRALAKMYGLPSEIALRQPFPGPGLALRIPCNPTGETVWPEDYDAMRTQLDKLSRTVINGTLAAHLLPVRAVGQKGDSRVYGNMVVLSGENDPEAIAELARIIPNALDVSRVCYSYDEVNPDKIQSIQQMVVRSTIAQLRQAEAAKKAIMAATGIDVLLSQNYVASLPVSLTGDGKPTLMARTFLSGKSQGVEDLVTGKAAQGGINVPEGMYNQTNLELRAAAEAHGYCTSIPEVTEKPPSTVELE